MGAATSTSPLALVAIACAFLSLSWGFKDHEFKTCDLASFCKRHRHRQPGSTPFFLKPFTSAIQPDGTFMGHLGSSEDPSVDLTLTISAYEPDIVRVKVTDEPSNKRFEVPDVLEDGLESKKKMVVPLQSGVVKHPDDEEFIDVWFGSSQNSVIRINIDPFFIDVFVDGDLSMSLGRKGLFYFEHLRQKKDDDPAGLWEENFRGNRDSKPKGPEAIAFDLTFYGTSHVYGIPEHATRLSLKPTRGKGISSDPYRLYNLDVFEYLHESTFGLYGSIPLMLSHSTRRTNGFFWLNSAEMWVDVLGEGWLEEFAAKEEQVSDGGEKNVEQEGQEEGEQLLKAPVEEQQLGTEEEKAPGKASKWVDDEADRQQVNTLWIAESGILDSFFFLGPSPKTVMQQYALVTGPSAMPPLFSLGYHQCRWNYKDEADVFQVDANFDFHDIPYDTLWLDIEHTDGKKYMTWDHTHFPDPIGMQNKLAAKGRHMVTIVDPHMKRESGYTIHEEASRKGYYVKEASGKDFDGWCWPGSSSYLDVLSPEIRQWWAGKFSLESYLGSTEILHIWNDMNEPSVFNGPEVTMPKDNIHYGGVEHRDVHNAYGYYYHMASAQGLLLRSGGKERPFVLSRAVFAGTQKVGAIWTGDNTADWNHLGVSVPMLLTLGISGIAFSGADVGGFFGNPDAELLTRWFQLGAFYPFFRGHAHLDTKRREPWIFGEPYTSHIREAIRTRYALLPYIYTLFHQAAVDGTPVMRPLWMEFPKQLDLFTQDVQFMLGPSLLIRAVMEQGANFVNVIFPGTEPWFDMKTGQAYATSAADRQLTMAVKLDTVPVFQRAGSIIPRKDRARRSSTPMKWDPFTLVVALNSTLEAEGELYVDDGQSFNFREGSFLQRRFSFSQGTLYSSPWDSQGGKFSSPCYVERVIVFGLPKQRASALRTALVNSPSGVQEVQVYMGSAWLRPKIPPLAVIIRNPRVKIEDNWSIRLFKP